MAIIRETYGWNRKAAEITTARFLELTGMSKQAFYNGRDELIESGIVQKNADTYTIDKATIIALERATVIAPKATVIALEGNDHCPTGQQSLPKKATDVALHYNKQIDKYIDSIDSAPIANLILLFQELHRENMQGVAYNYQMNKDERIIDNLLVNFTPEQIAILMDQFFKTKIKWVQGKSKNLRIFNTVVDDLVQEIKKKSEGEDERNPYLKHA